MAANSPPPGSTRQNQSPWLFLDAAHTIFSLAKRRVYTGTLERGKLTAEGEIPKELTPRLEEQPKWAVLAEVLQEIENDLYLNPIPLSNSSGATLIMCSDQKTCRQIREYLQTMHDHIPGEGDEEEEEPDDDQEPKGPSAKLMMRRKLRGYFAWKKDFAKASAALFAEQNNNTSQYKQYGAGQKRDQHSYRGRAPPNKRRRIRGGSLAAAAPTRASGGAIHIPEEQPNQVAELIAGIQPTDIEQQVKQEVAADPMENMEDYYELFELKDLVVVHPYDNDNDEHVLEQLKPRFVIMYDPDTAFIRRVEVR